jgi:hypothetical protein
VGNNELRQTTNDSGPNYAYGMGDNFFACTLSLTTPELSSLNTLTQLTAGAATSTSWKLVATDTEATSKTFAATGVLRDYFVRRGENRLLIDIFVRITGNTVTIS